MTKEHLGAIFINSYNAYFDKIKPIVAKYFEEHRNQIQKGKSFTIQLSTLNEPLILDVPNVEPDDLSIDGIVEVIIHHLFAVTAMQLKYDIGHITTITINQNTTNNT